MTKYSHDFKLTELQTINPSYFVLHLQCSVPLPEINPGQFAEILVPSSPETYLRRPFSVYEVDYKRNVLTLLIKVVGKGTAVLSRLPEGTMLNLLYPLGNAFTIPESGKALLIGGGVGIAPMLYLSECLSKAGIPADILIGGRTSADIIEPEKYSACGNVFITTDDGSAGEKGMVTEHSVFRNETFDYSVIYTCGPDPMMKAVAKLAAAKGVTCEASLENLMACGIGACLCCVVETVDGNKASCIDGPVFDVKKLKGWT